VEIRDLLYLLLGAIGLFLLARVPGQRAALLVDRPSQDALVGQLIEATQARDGLLLRAEAAERRAEAAERRCEQLQGMVDQLIPAAGNDRSLVIGTRELLRTRDREIAELKTEVAALRLVAAGGGGMVTG